jgi:hypothetical protein
MVLLFASAVAHAQQTPIKMTFSGNAGATTIDLKQTNANTGEENLAGNGTLGSFSFRLIKASATAPQPSSTCAGLFFPNTAGGGIFRFQDGSLLYVSLTGGGDCIDFVHMMATCTLTFKINGGTVSRLRRASSRLPRRPYRFWRTPHRRLSSFPKQEGLRGRFPDCPATGILKTRGNRKVSRRSSYYRK